MSGNAGLYVEVRTSRTPLVIAVHGEIDSATASALTDAVQAAARTVATSVLDLTDVPFLDVAGARAIQRVTQELARRGHIVRIGPTSEPVARVLELIDVARRTPRASTDAPRLRAGNRSNPGDQLDRLANCAVGIELQLIELVNRRGQVHGAGLTDDKLDTQIGQLQDALADLTERLTLRLQAMRSLS